jgi:hypothetical protein
MSSFSKMFGICVGAVFAASVSACAAEPLHDREAPETTLESLDEADQGTSYNGWSQSVYASYNWCMSVGSFDHTLSRSSGDSTRGGGGCAVEWQSGSSCSADSTCVASAQSMYGASAYGYCYSGQCYLRPGSQATYCSLNANRSPGTVTGLVLGSAQHVVGCMTKTAGPNTACGGTNTSLYMRSVWQAEQYCVAGP